MLRLLGKQLRWNANCHHTALGHEPRTETLMRPVEMVMGGCGWVKGN